VSSQVGLRIDTPSQYQVPSGGKEKEKEKEKNIRASGMRYQISTPAN
jgi:hypothetical protein